MRNRRQPLIRFINKEIQQFAYNRQWIAAVGRPVVFQIELTNHCPMTCEMCPRTEHMQRPLGFMDPAIYRKVVDEAAETTSRVFLHHFGESLLHPGLGEFITYARKHGIGTYLSANPALLTRPRIEAVVDNGLHELVLSLDGATAETSAKVRGRAAADVELAEKRIESLIEYRKEARSTKPLIVMQIVRQRQNLHEVDDWIRKWDRKPGIDRIKMKSYVTWDGRAEEINRLRIEDRTKKPRVVCDKPWTSVTILWDGRVVPCCFDCDGHLTLGNVGEQSLKSIWHGERLRNLRACHSSGDLASIKLCAMCVDKEGYPTKKWYYPLNRLQQESPLGNEWTPSE